MHTSQALGTKNKCLLQVLVNEIQSGRVQKHQRRPFIPYSERMILMGLPDAENYAGWRSQREELNELNEWTKSTPGIPHIAGLIVNNGSGIQSEGCAESHGLEVGEVWEDCWLPETPKSVDFD